MQLSLRGVAQGISAGPASSHVLLRECKSLSGELPYTTTPRLRLCQRTRRSFGTGTTSGKVERDHYPNLSHRLPYLYTIHDSIRIMIGWQEEGTWQLAMNQHRKLDVWHDSCLLDHAVMQLYIFRFFGAVVFGIIWVFADREAMQQVMQQMQRQIQQLQSQMEWLGVER